MLRTLCFLVALLIGLPAASLRAESATVLTYDTPCDIGDYRLNGMPLGNGSLGAMFSGGVSRDVILLNHDRLRPNSYREKAKRAEPGEVERVRALCRQGKWDEAQEAFNRLSVETGGQRRLNVYHPVGDLILCMEPADAVESYRRTLDLQTGVGEVVYRVDGVQFTRTYFVSKADRLLVVHLAADRPGSIQCELGLGRPPVGGCALDAAVENSTLTLHGRYGDGTTFAACVSVVHRGGTLSGASNPYRGPGEVDGNVAVALARLSVRGADEVTLLVSLDVDNPAMPNQPVSGRSSAETALDYATLLAGHVAEHRQAFGRVMLRLGDETAQDGEGPTTGGLVEAVRRGEVSPRLIEEVFQAGRYVLLASSRPGSLPPNLQGLWSDGFRPAWQCRYQLDMNSQMCAWPAEVTGLSRCHLPLLDFVDRLVPAARQHARDKYGCRGMILPVGTDGLNVRYPTNSECQGIAGWLARHYWEHYEFTGDREFLASRTYPVMKDVAEFFEDFLFEGDNGRLVILPSGSPENAPEGRKGRLAMNATIDVAVAHELLSHAIAASTILQVDEDRRTGWQAMLDRMPEWPLDADGALLEWNDPSAGEQQHHRHLSHLYPLYPGDAFTPEETPELVAAAVKAIRKREAAFQGEVVGWTYPWLAALYARAGLGDEALRNLNLFCQGFLTGDNLLSTIGDQSGRGLGRTSHGRLVQIEAGLGATAAIAEMLLQSHRGLIRILPALPEAWPSGEVRGLRARGGFEVDIAWHDRQITRLTLTSALGGPCRIRLVRPAADSEHRARGATWEMGTQPGQRYELIGGGGSR